MIKPNQKIEMKWNGNNKKYYIEKGYIFTKYGERFIVSVEDLSKASKVEIIVVCDICNKEEYETSAYNANKSKQHVCEICKNNKDRSKIKVNCANPNCNETFLATKGRLNRSKTGNLFCSNKCVGEFRDKKIELKCTICGTPYKVKLCHVETSVVCSIDCQKKWQSEYLVGENANNYKGGNRIKDCENCGESFICGTPSEYKSRRFCSVECKQEHWVNNTLISEEFIQNRYEGNLRYRKEYTIDLETKPERMTREYLSSLGLIKNKDFFQERGFMRKYFVDFYIPKGKIIIEVMGDYWHGNPRIYGEGVNKIPLSESQIDRIKKDKIKKQDFVRNNYTYIEIWESDIYEDINKVMKEKLLKIYPLNDYMLDTQTVKVGG